MNINDNMLICSKEYIENKIKSSFQNIFFLEIIDQSEMHENHFQRNDKKNISHLKLVISSDDFNGKSKIQSHQLIYSLFKEELSKNIIHAIQIEIK